MSTQCANSVPMDNYQLSGNIFRKDCSASDTLSRECAWILVSEALGALERVDWTGGAEGS